LTVFKVVGGRFLEALDPSKVHLTETSFRIKKKPLCNPNLKFSNRTVGVHNENSTGKSGKDGAEADG
jgi:hypothetical protein